MKLLFTLLHYFPHGGLQRDFLEVARLCHERGHTVTAFVAGWEGSHPDWLTIEYRLPTPWSNHRRVVWFDQQLAQWREEITPDVTVAFDRLPHADIYFAADTCYAEKMAGNLWIKRLLPRYRTYLALERAVMKPQGPQQLLFLNKRHSEGFLSHYPLPKKRYEILPPGIRVDRLANTVDARSARAELGWDDDTTRLLFVGSNFRLKGLDRAIQGLRSLPNEAAGHLDVLGEDDVAPFRRLAAQYGLNDHVHFHGANEEVSLYMQAADLLVHPSHRDSAGMVLLEALASGLPVLTSEACGYAEYVRAANAGTVLKEPFSQKAFNAALQDLLANDRSALQRNARTWVSKNPLDSLHQRVADIIETVA